MCKTNNSIICKLISILQLIDKFFKYLKEKCKVPHCQYAINQAIKNNHLHISNYLNKV